MWQISEAWCYMTTLSQALFLDHMGNGGRVENCYIYIQDNSEQTVWRGSERGKKNLRRGEQRREKERECERKVKFPFLISHGVEVTCIFLKVVSGIWFPPPLLFPLNLNNSVFNLVFSPQSGVCAIERPTNMSFEYEVSPLPAGYAASLFGLP